jgi:hypothetical protein
MRAIPLDTKERADLALVVVCVAARAVAHRPALANGATVALAKTTAGSIESGRAFLLVDGGGADLAWNALMEHALLVRGTTGQSPPEAEWMHNALRTAAHEEAALVVH